MHIHTSICLCIFSCVWLCRPLLKFSIFIWNFYDGITWLEAAISHIVSHKQLQLMQNDFLMVHHWFIWHWDGACQAATFHKLQPKICCIQYEHNSFEANFVISKRQLRSAILKRNFEVQFRCAILKLKMERGGCKTTASFHFSSKREKLMPIYHAGVGVCFFFACCHINALRCDKRFLPSACRSFSREKVQGKKKDGWAAPLHWQYKCSCTSKRIRRMMQCKWVGFAYSDCTVQVVAFLIFCCFETIVHSLGSLNIPVLFTMLCSFILVHRLFASVFA